MVVEHEKQLGRYGGKCHGLVPRTMDPRLYALKKLYHVPEKLADLYGRKYTEIMACQDLVSFKKTGRLEHADKITKYHKYLKKDTWHKGFLGMLGTKDLRMYVFKKVYHMSKSEIADAMKAMKNGKEFYTQEMAAKELRFQEKKRQGHGGKNYSGREFKYQPLRRVNFLNSKKSRVDVKYKQGRQGYSSGFTFGGESPTSMSSASGKSPSAKLYSPKVYKSRNNYIRQGMQSVLQQPGKHGLMASPTASIKSPVSPFSPTSPPVSPMSPKSPPGVHFGGTTFAPKPVQPLGPLSQNAIIKNYGLWAHGKGKFANRNTAVRTLHSYGFDGPVKHLDIVALDRTYGQIERSFIGNPKRTEMESVFASAREYIKMKKNIMNAMPKKGLFQRFTSGLEKLTGDNWSQQYTPY